MRISQHFSPRDTHVPYVLIYRHQAIHFFIRYYKNGVFFSIFTLEMRISMFIFSLASSKKASTPWLRKETDVQQAYFNNEELVLGDPKERASRPWDACGDKPAIPPNAVSVECRGAFCVAICPIGWRSEKIWRMKCQTERYNKHATDGIWWSHNEFSPCITCPENVADDFDKKSIPKRIAVFHSTSKRNLPVVNFSCGKFKTHINPWIGFTKGSTRGVAYRRNNHKVECQCKSNEFGKKTCDWLWRPKDYPSTGNNKTVWTAEDIDTINCWMNMRAYPCNRLPCE